MLNENQLSIFREQIEEDIEQLKEILQWDSNTHLSAYTFNYWILSNLYNLDVEECNNNITEFNDKGIDCFVHFEEDKELYIIQNKFYSLDTQVNVREISDFVMRPLSILNNGNYKNTELQKIYNKAKNDNDYKIFLHFYATTEINSSDISIITSEFNKNNTQNNVYLTINDLYGIKIKYYGKTYKSKQKLDAKLSVNNKAAFIAIRPEEYKLHKMSEAYYVMAKIVDVYKLWKDAENLDYPLFEENIREYLGGTSGINKGIVDTLENENERANFFYYNNGITIICDKAKADSKNVFIENPQIVNGCQTVNSIALALNKIEKYEEVFKDIYVMTKVLVWQKKESSFYRDIVRYTNSQNSINEKVFGATLQPFFTIQENLKKDGLLLIVKQSDKYQFKQHFKDNKELFNILEKANKNSLFQFKKYNDLQIFLETLVQIILAFNKDAYYAYTKKSLLLKPTNKEYYENFASKIGDMYTTDSMVKLILIYKRAELDKKESIDKKSPIPYYLLNFIGKFLSDHKIDKQKFLKSISSEDLIFIYNEFKRLPSKYYEKFKENHKIEYNKMIKMKIDEDLMVTIIHNHFISLREHNEEKYSKFMDIINKYK